MSTASKSKSQPDQFGDLIDIDKIEVGDRLRALNLEKVEALAGSMSHQGQLHPIVTRAVEGGSEFTLVVGLHCLKAAMKLGWTQIRATAHSDMSDDVAALAEIDENLCRSELSPAERAAHVGRRKEIYEKLNPETKHGAARGVGKGKRGSGKGKSKEPKLGSFSASTAKATGQSKTKIKRDAKRAKDLGERLNKINGTCLDTGVELDALAKLSEAEQEDLVARAAAGEQVSAKAVLAAKKSGSAKQTTLEFPEHQGGSQPVLMASAEKSIEQVQAQFAALAGEEVPPAGGSAEIDTGKVADVAVPAAETPPDTKPDDGHSVMAVTLKALMNEALVLCEAEHNWQGLRATKEQRDAAIKELYRLRDLFAKIAAPKAVH
jgi:hypothetical protein